MKKSFRKVTAVITLVCMLMAFIPQAYAVDSLGRIPGSKISSSYAQSVYYTRAKNAYNNAIANGLSDAQRFVNVAKSQAGYMASPKKGDYNGDGDGNVFTSGPYVEYSRHMGVNGNQWCASYVSWVAKAAGIPEDIISTGTRCGHWRTTSPKGSKLIKIWTNDFKTYIDYKPQVGDIVLYTGTCNHNGSGCGKYENSYKVTAHVGIVVEVSNTRNSNGSWTFKTIERTTKKTSKTKIDGVQYKTFNTKQTRGSSVKPCTCKNCTTSTASQVKLIQGFYHPNWADSVNNPGTGNNTNTGTTNNNTNTGTTNNNTNTGTTNNNTNTGTTNNNTNTNTNTGTTVIPGKIDHSNTNYITTSKGSIAWATDSTYLNKQYVNGTNATLVANIKKKAGTHLNYTAIIVYDSNWNVLADKQFTNTNVSDSNTNFHAWFNMKNDLGITLKPSSKYYYRIYAKVDGEKIASPHWNFTTASK